MKKIVLYNESKQTGGHEVLSVEVAKVLSTMYSVYYIVSSYNIDLINRLNQIEGIKLLKIDYAFNRFQIINNLFEYRISSIVENILKEILPDLCIAVQGTIDSSYLIIPASKKLKIPVVSYIPIAFDLRNISKYKYIGFVKDILQSYYYKQPDFFITINERLADNIKCKSKNSNVFIVYNGINFSKYKNYNKSVCRSKYEIDHNTFVVSYIGRLEYWHKGLDYYLKCIDENIDKLVGMDFVFAGKGVASKEIISLSKKYSNIHYIPWSDNVGEIYSLSDCFCLPSRFEGCPIALLEALYYKLPIIASNIPEIEAIIDRKQLFDVGNQLQLLNKLLEAKNNRVLPTSCNFENYSLKKFQSSFAFTINHILSVSVPK